MPGANYLSQDGADLQIGTVNIYLQFTAGTSGAVPTTFASKTGIVSVTKSTNDYIVLFDSAYLKLVDYNIQIQQLSFAATGTCYGNISARSFTDSTPTVTMSFYRGSDGTAVALTEGDIVTARFEFTYLAQPNE